MAPLGRLRAPACRAPPRRLCSRHLRHLRQGRASDPKQGVPGARVRHASDHRRHARRSRAARRPRERAADPAGRSPGAGRGSAATRRRLAARTAPGRGGTPGLHGPRLRGRARYPLAQAPRGGRPVRPRAPQPKTLLWAAIGAYAVAFTALSTLRQRSFETGRFDLGNMVQAVWSTAHGHPLQITNLNGEQASRLAAHVDPILVVFAPLWWVWPHPSLLLVSQAIVVSLG